MDIKFKCFNCQQSIAIDEKASGQFVHCPFCSKRLVVPDNPSFAPLEPTPRQSAPPFTLPPIPTPAPTAGKKKTWSFLVLGAVGVLTGMGIFVYGMSGHASDVYQQIYLAIYIVGGAVVFGLAAILLALTTD